MSAIRLFLAILGASVALVIMSPVLVVWFVFRAFESAVGRLAKLIEPSYRRWNELTQFDPHLGWRPKPDLDTHYITGTQPEVYHLVTDSKGWFGSLELEESELVVVGDSYAMGYSIDASEAFPSLLSDLKVKAIGCNGYNLVQEWRLMQQVENDLAGKTIVWMIYFGNDLVENLQPFIGRYRYPAPFIRRNPKSATWGIVDEHINYEQSSKNARPLSHSRELHESLYAPTHMLSRAMDACAYLVEQAHGYLSERHCNLVVLGLPFPETLSSQGRDRLARDSIYPGKFNPRLPDQMLGQICTGIGVQYISGFDHFSRGDYRELDDHWNSHGHRKMASLIRKLHAQ